MNNKTSPEELQELKRKRRMEKGKAKLQLDRERRKKIREANAGKVKEDARTTLSSINNEKPPMSQKNQKNKDKTESKGIGRVGTSKANKKGEQKRVNRYNQRVWKGWRDSDGKASPVVSYKMKDLEK